MSQRVFGINPLVRNYFFRKLAFTLFGTGLMGIGGYKFNSQKEGIFSHDDIKVMTFTQMQSKDNFRAAGEETKLTSITYQSGLPSNKPET